MENRLQEAGSGRRADREKGEKAFTDLLPEIGEEVVGAKKEVLERRIYFGSRASRLADLLKFGEDKGKKKIICFYL